MNAKGIEPPSRWRMAILLLSSACLSGIAVVVWNRRTLSRIRNLRKIEPEPRESEFI